MQNDRDLQMLMELFEYLVSIGVISDSNRLIQILESIGEELKERSQIKQQG